MMQVALAPCSPFTVTKSLMRASAALAERFDCRLHTHLGETIDEEDYCLSRFQCRPVDYLEDTGWLGGRTWLAHGIHFNAEEIAPARAARRRRVPLPDLEHGARFRPCRTRELEEAGAPVGLGVDGSASNDNSNLMEGVRHALMLNRLTYNAADVTHLDALRWARRARRDASGATTSA